MPKSFELAPGIELGGERPVLIAGPCAVESADLCLEIAGELKALAGQFDLPMVFKGSYDKANRTSPESFRSIGFEAALEALGRVRSESRLPVLTDVHEPSQVPAVSEVVDILQVPAFLCRQTDLIQAVARSGLPVNIKKGQFMSPDDMQYALEKVRVTGNQRVFLTERGTTFGYHNLVVDMRSLPIMRRDALVIFDVSHSVQMPGGAGGASSGQREFGPFLARAAAAVGVDGFYIETHPAPDRALSDGQNMVPLKEMPSLIEMIMSVWEVGERYREG
jgi:2-dehydro-3-deoxyphosphooctonate aldolase (KDO 8-P synthase)